ncbi:MAG: HNH endonuclease [Mesorhizobium sp.]|nr:MAG: HNH endonuclease [Mesorhizobium sp.]
MSNGSRRPQLRAILREKQGGRCCYCDVRMRISFKSKMRPDSETLEHLDRRTDRGGNDRGNIALACYRCNTGRGDVDWLTYKTIKRDEHYERW